MNQYDNILLSTKKYKEQRDYWMTVLGDLDPAPLIPRKTAAQSDGSSKNQLEFELDSQLAGYYLKLSKNSDLTLYIVLVAAWVSFLYKYTGKPDLYLACPVYQENDPKQVFNDLVILRRQVNGAMTFKELLLEVKEALVKAFENQDYPLPRIVEELNYTYGQAYENLAELIFASENLYLPDERELTPSKLLISFDRRDQRIRFTFRFDPACYATEEIQRMSRYFQNVLTSIQADIAKTIRAIEMFSDDEKRRLGAGEKGPIIPFSKPQSISGLIDALAQKSPEAIAVHFENTQLTYGELNRRTNQLTSLLREQGVGSETIVAMLTGRSLEMIIGLLAIIKAGGCYLPIAPEYPKNRVKMMLDDSGASFVVTREEEARQFSFPFLQNKSGPERFSTPIVNCPREQIVDLEQLPIPDRTLIDYQKYNPFIGQAAVKNAIAIQATRGCPYNCAYCHKIWPKGHIRRPAEHIFQEVQLYYQAGIRRFVFVDDIFNLDQENSRRFFQLVLDHQLKIQIFFPNGLRGDILTKDYIDLMVRAGTVSFALSLETASPRLQRLIGKNLNLAKFKENLEYITTQYPEVILELFTMHGFPTEQEAEAMQTLDFIKSIHWIHFPYIHILRIYPGTDMAQLAVNQGISPEKIENSLDLALHELPETLPFSKNFTAKYQAEFLNDYFLDRERLIKILPLQMKVLTEDELVQKYNSYLPAPIDTFSDLLAFAGITRDELGQAAFLPVDFGRVPDFNEKIKKHFPARTPDPDAFRLLLIDLSQFFSHETNHMLYDVIEAPLGCLYLLTYLNHKLGPKINGKIIKAKTDFDSYDELWRLIQEFQPDALGIRGLTFYRGFFHKTISLLRQWGLRIPIIAGGPYATSSYEDILEDRNIDIVVRGEGEITLLELIEVMLQNGKKLPEPEVLKNIPGIAFVANKKAAPEGFNRSVLLLDQVRSQEAPGDKELAPEFINQPEHLVYTLFTSGSTGKPKGVMIEQRSVLNLINALIHEIYCRYTGPLRIALLAPYVFDASVQQIFAALFGGHQLFIVPEDIRSDGTRLARYYLENNIDISDGTPTHLNILAASETNLLEKIPVKHFIIGGEKLTVNTVRHFLGRFDEHPPLITNVYGPTECCVDVTGYLVTTKPDDATGSVPIGKPLANVKIRILGRNLEPTPPGMPGEIYISGDCLGRGYLNDPQLTHEKFVVVETSPPREGIHETSLQQRQQRMYKTGDLGYWCADGNIQFITRIDSQVKVRGYRIETGEIEARLLEHELIKEAIVIAKEDQEGNHYLCAYFTGDPELAISAIREFLGSTLPEYMIPSQFIPLPQMPMTPNGKINRAALLQITGAGSKSASVPPQNQTQALLVNIWREILDTPDIGIQDNFFDLGGHSLKATILMSRIHKVFNVEIPLRTIFKVPTIQELSGQIMAAAENQFSAIPAAAPRDHYPLSPAQKRLYVLNQLEETQVAYNIPSLMEIHGALDRNRLEAAYRYLIERHETLRTSFEVVDGAPVQKIHPRVDFSIDYRDGASQKRAELIGELPQLVRPFDLSKAPLMRVSLIKVADDRHLLFNDIHHIIADGESIGILTREFMAVYSGQELPELKIQYKDYSAWQTDLLAKVGHAGAWKNQLLSEVSHADARQNDLLAKAGHAENLPEEQSLSGRFAKQAQYWQELFRGEIPALNLPADFLRPGVRTFEGDSLGFAMEQQSLAKLSEIASRADGTMFMVLLAGFTILLYKYTSQEDIIIGIPVAGRNHDDLAGVIGMFVNTVVMRNYPKGGKTFSEFLNEVKDGALKAFENQDYPFDQLLEQLDLKRDLSRNPIFDVMLAHQNLGTSAPGLGDLKFIPEHFPKHTAKFDLTLYALENGPQIDFEIEYSANLFKKETMIRFSNHLINILHAIIANPAITLADIEILTAAEKKTLLLEFNDTTSDYPRARLIFELFEEQAAKTPDNIAVLFQDQRLSYGELNSKANQLAGRLRKNGVKPGTFVGIMAKRSLEMYIGILGILKAGGAYLPIDPDYPMERIRYIIEDSTIQALLTQADLQNKAGFYDEVINLDDPGLFQGDGSNLPRVNSPQDPIYIIYTSGSTGKPKGVMVEHMGVVNVLWALQKYYPLGAYDAYLLKTTYTFDVSVAELFGWFFEGGRLVILEPGGEKDPSQILQTIERHQVTHLNFVPSMFNLFLEGIASAGAGAEPGLRSGLHSLKYIFVAGEPIPGAMVKKFFQLVSDVRLENIYGPTESTIYASRYPLTGFQEESTVPIGKPLANLWLYILDPNGHLQPVGVPGELHIAGVGLARGYLNNPELTGEKFVKAMHNVECIMHNEERQRAMHNVEQVNPEHSGSGESNGFNYELCIMNYTLYKTGDLARWRPDGNIEFYGRIDNQVKIRGFRIELGEIEAQLRNHPAISAAVVIAGEEQEGVNGAVGSKYLCAYFVADQKINRSALREFLAQKIPEYMIPAYFVQLEKIPMTWGGKIDRRSLPKFSGTVDTGAAFIAPRNSTEATLAEIWKKVLDLTQVGIQDNFFDLGGHSLKATLMIGLANREFKVDIPLREVFTHPTVAALAELISQAEDQIYRAIQPLPSRDDYELSSAQKRMYFVDQATGVGTGYNMPQIFKIEGALDLSRLQGALNRLIQRQESLRTSFHFREGAPVQMIHPQVDFQIRVIEVGQATEPIIAGLVADFIRPFDLEQAPLFRMGLVKEGSDPVLLMFDIHHIIADGTSINIFIAELFHLYMGQQLPVLPIQYKDFAAWQNKWLESEIMKHQENYWLNVFLQPLHRLELPLDYPRPKVQSFEGDIVQITITPEVTTKLNQMADEAGATLYMALMAVYNFLLAKWSGQNDIIVGTGTAGRKNADLEFLIGMFINTFALRSRLTVDKPFREFLAEVVHNAINAYDNQDYPFERLIEKLELPWDFSRNPLADTMFVLQNMDTEEFLIPDLKLTPYNSQWRIAKCDLSLYAAEYQQALHFTFEYCTKLFKRSTIENLAHYFVKIIQWVTENPNLRLPDIQAIDDEAQQKLISSIPAQDPDLVADFDI